MPTPRKPNPLPSLMPFVAMAILLLVIYGAVLLFPTIRSIIDRQDCVGSGRTDCDPRP